MPDTAEHVLHYTLPGDDINAWLKVVKDSSNPAAAAIEMHSSNLEDISKYYAKLSQFLWDHPDIKIEISDGPMIMFGGSSESISEMVLMGLVEPTYDPELDDGES